jgi:ParB/RepB/Spo0J family partition protein
MEKIVEIVNIPIEKIKYVKNVRNEGETKDSKTLKSLIESLKTEGQIQPIAVYKDIDEKYAIIYGHRRYLAAEVAGLTELKCIIRTKPKDDVELIELQVAENEHSKSMTAADRENYITRLLELNVEQKSLADKLHISQSLVSMAVKAKEGRRQFNQRFIDAGLTLDTLGAYLVEGATLEAVDKTIVEIKNGKPMRAVLQKLAAEKESGTGKGRPRAKPLVEQARAIPGTSADKMNFISTRLLESNKTRHVFDEFGDERKEIVSKLLAGLLVGDVDEVPETEEWRVVKRCLVILNKIN